jgi:proteasome lid subunit RPN8/RPN11
VLSRSCLDEIYDHAERAYPEECCGLILRSLQVRRCANAQDELHERDPDRYPRTNRTGYALGVADLLFLQRSFDGDDPVIAVYHSHPDVGAYFSAEDRAWAMPDGQPLYPVEHVVIDVRAGRAIGCVSFGFQHGDFVQRELDARDPHPSRTERPGRQ